MQKDSWMAPPDVLVLKPHQVDIWRVFVDREPASVQLTESTLSADEAERAARFHFDRDRHRFIIAHTALRDILSRYLNCPPKELTFSVDEYGKPALKEYNLEFNLSHSGDFALIVVTQGNKVGVDVEHIRPDLETLKIAKRFFSAQEISELESLPSSQQQMGFFNCWTRKEAYIKAHGLGLSLALDSFDISLTPNEPAIIRATRPDSTESARWSLRSLDVDSDYVAAVAIEGQDLEFRLCDWNNNSEGVK